MKLKFSVVSAMLVLLSAGASQAQVSNDQESIKTVIQTLFKGMELGDSAMARKTFADKVTSATIFKDKSGVVKIQREESISGFMDAIGTPHKDVWYEEIWNLQIQVDGDFAQAWCDYALYAGNSFSHCGVDAFHLVRENGEWKIFHLADTRRKSPCNIPQPIQQKHK